MRNSTHFLRHRHTWLPLIRQHASESNPSHAITYFKTVQIKIPPVDDAFIYASLIKSCNKLFLIPEVKSIQCRVIRLGLDRNVNVLNSLVYTYCNADSLFSYARKLFDRIPDKNVVTVNCMIAGLLKNDLLNEGVTEFNKILGGCYGLSLRPNYVTLVILISGCAESEVGFRIGRILRSYCCKAGLGLLEVCNALIDMYKKFGCMDDAEMLFRESPERDLVSWNTMIAGYAKINNCEKATLFCREMRSCNVEYDRVTMISLISGFANSRDVRMGKVVHGYMKAKGIGVNVSVGTALINMYSKCGCIACAKRVFDELRDQDIASWNSMIHGYVQCKRYFEAMKLFNEIVSRELIPDEVTMLGLISACRDSGEVHFGIRLHSYIERSAHLDGKIVVCNALIDMYAKFGNIVLAKSIFEKMPRKDVVSWTSIIVGHALNGEGKEAINLFRLMVSEKIEPNAVTFVGILLACDHAGLIEDGRNLYNLMCCEYRIEPMIEHCGCMVDMLARSGMLSESLEFVKNLPMRANTIIWRILMNGCRVNGNFHLGLSLNTAIEELHTPIEPDNQVVSSTMFAEAGRWSDVLLVRSSTLHQRLKKELGKSSISDLAS